MTEQEMINKIRETPILARLARAQDMIGYMTSKRRPPMMSIPTQWYDEDVFIVQTLMDAAEYLAAVEESEKITLARRDERQKTIADCVTALNSFTWPDYLGALRGKLQRLIISEAIQEEGENDV